MLVTGGCGFIGSNFINYYKSKYPERKVVVIDKMDYCSTKYDISYDKLIIGNLQNKELVFHVLKDYNIDIVVHFAAQTHVDNSFGNSVEFTKDNILGTHTLLECCRVYGGVKRFLHFSTDEVYGEVDIDHEGCSEKSLLNPTNPYAATKAGAEFIARSYYYSFNLPIVIARCNNVYGPRQYPEKLIPKFIMLLMQDNKCTIQGEGVSRRNFIHAYDVARAVEVILEKGDINHIYNIGTNNEYSVKDITRMLVAELKPGTEVDDWIEYVDDRNFNDFRYAIDASALNNLGWREEVPFSEGLKDTIKWYRDHSVACFSEASKGST